MSPHPPGAPAPRSAATAPITEAPVLVRLWRGAHVESQHRGAWVWCDSAGTVLDGAGDWQQPIFARSSVKSLQALPLIETGAARRFDYSAEELALALSSHNAETRQTALVLGVLRRLDLDVQDLRCGPEQPRDEAARAELEVRGARPSGLHNNCSGKHTGFLALARHLGADPARYLDPACEPQRLVRRAVLDMTGVAESELSTAIDGCSAPTFRLPLAGLATAFARVANPSGLSSERREACLCMQQAVAAHPDLIAGKKKRICTDLARVSGGRLFPKIGAEGVYALGVVGADRGLALKIEDGSNRALHALVLGLIRRFRLLGDDALAALAEYSGDPLRNWAGLEVGRTEVVA